MKGFMAAATLVCCALFVIPMVFLIIEHMIVGKDSIYQKLLNNMNDE